MQKAYNKRINDNIEDKPEDLLERKKQVLLKMDF